MSDIDPSRSSHHWLTLATGDLAAATALVAETTVPPRVAAGLAAQAAEKALKAAIANSGTDPPRSHDLVGLAHRIRGVVGLTVSEDDLRRLTDAHLLARYPEPDEASYDIAEATDLVRVASAVVREVIAAIQPQGLAQLIAQGRVTPALDPVTEVLPTPIPASTETDATASLLAEQDDDPR